MSLHAHPLVIVARGLGRRLGLNRLVAGLRRPRDYEERFGRAMLERTRTGDCVWDVGANVGHYTRLFAKRVGPTGTVYAIEPSPPNLVVLRQAMATAEVVSIVDCALGAQAGTATLRQGSDPLGAESRLHDDDGGAPGTFRVPVNTAAGLVRLGMARQPTIVKIDAEGWELEVIQGFGPLLRDAELHTVCVEVHFGLLAGRGLPNAPADIERLLRDAGLTVTWPDASHILAVR